MPIISGRYVPKDEYSLLKAAGSPFSQADTVRALLNEGAYLTFAYDGYRRTPLHLAAQSGSSQAVEVIRALIERDVVVDRQDEYGRSPLHLAARSSSSQAVEVVRALIEAGADVMAQDSKGLTPLHEAVQSSLQVVRTLIEAGADVMARDHFRGFTPLHAMARSPPTQAVEILRVLVEAGADATAQDEYGCNPLHQAASSWSDPPILSLIPCEVRTMPHQYGHTPLHAAARSPPQAEVVRALIEAGADVMARTRRDFGLTPLDGAARYPPPQAMEVVRQQKCHGMTRHDHGHKGGDTSPETGDISSGL